MRNMFDRYQETPLYFNKQVQGGGDISFLSHNL